MTLGDKGALWVRDQEVLLFPGYRVDAVDSTGAGDAFAAGLIHAFFHKKKPEQDAMAFACACAAVKCTQPGPRLKADEAAVSLFMDEKPASQSPVSIERGL